MDERYQNRLREILDGHSEHLYLDVGFDYFHKHNTCEGLLWMLTAFNRFQPRLPKKAPGRLVFRVC